LNLTSTLFDSAKELATQWQAVISDNRESSEKAFHVMMQRMLKEPRNKVFLIELLDQSFRSENPSRVADQLEHLFSKYGHTEIFSQFEELLIWTFRHIGILVPQISIPLFIKYLRKDVSAIVVKGESAALGKHLRQRRSEGTRVNINLIGEAVLGEREAQERIEKYLHALQNPDIDYISIKISTIFSQITPLAHDWTVKELIKRLDTVYSAAIDNSFVDKDGIKKAKFVNLDMEEYRDLHLTLDAFKQTLMLDKFHDLHAGIVLQAYMPDTFAEVKRLASWAKERVEAGGAPIKVRLVKGANQEMELTEASLRGWECVTYLDKAQSDANYKLIMDYLLSPEIAPYVNTGIASHNLFDQALAWTLAKERNVQAFHTAEMLEGMSETAYKTLQKEGMNVILYAPIATAKTFTNAIAYLVRRFDENTAEQNFLRHSFGLSINTPSWDTLVQSFEDSIKALEDLPLTPYRHQNRNIEPEVESVDLAQYRFKNAIDTDFSLESNRIWAEDIRDKWQDIGKSGGYHAKPVIAGKEIDNQERVAIIDKSRFHEGIEVGSYSYATEAQLKKAIKIAKEDPDRWRSLDIKERQRILMNAAIEIEKRRGDLIGVAAAEVGKVFTETDVEVTEAIDFLNFYPYSVRQIEGFNGIHTRGKGVGLIVSPWNFPVAIPLGGVAAALAAGNTVLLKPATDSVLCAYMLCEALWAAGVSKNTLQFVPCSGREAGEHLIKSNDIDFVIFTGGEKTAYEMLKSKPGLFLSAETGGKDATIVTSMADRDQAVKNVVASAFNNSGQKCSATSLLVLEKEVYNDQFFQDTLLDVASSINVGSVWDFKNRIGTLSNKPAGNLEKSLSYLDAKEKWILKPSFEDENPYMLKPAIRYGTQKGDFCHMNELFGPVLSVMKAENLDEAIDIVNATGYGLTSGIESLDKREQQQWEKSIKAGNLYINRMTTGAIVLRQPFGGMGKSAIGSGRKAGGMNYVSQFMHIASDGHMLWKSTCHEEVDRLHALLDGERRHIETIDKAMQIASHFACFLVDEFLQDHDYVNIRGERNTIRYIPVKSVMFRFCAEDSLVSMLVSIVAAKMVGAKVHISLNVRDESEALTWLQHKAQVLLDESDTLIFEDENALGSSISNFERVRFLHATVPDSLYIKAADEAIHIACEPFVSHGRIELMHYFLEQSISDSYHRYGNLGLKGLSKKRGI
jgi:RHH-type transcriptional regulator, proline utilization regulon repressor / proline dehydrogenase / delta 1-pyrroline-5-carboxylate dehydrogenase